jgi:hypothetical protein
MTSQSKFHLLAVVVVVVECGDGVGVDAATAVAFMIGFCFRRNTLRCFSTFANALLRLKKTF